MSLSFCVFCVCADDFDFDFEFNFDFDFGAQINYKFIPDAVC